MMMIMIGEIQKIHSSNFNGCDSDNDYEMQNIHSSGSQLQFLIRFL